MRRLSALAVTAVLAVAAVWAWRSGLVVHLRGELIEAQRAFQSVLAGGVRAVKADEPGAALGLAGLGFLYGVLHAAGPGHGKVVLGAWAFSARARIAKVAALTLAASLAQSGVAIALVLGGAWIFGLGRAELTALSEGAMLRLASAVLVALGLWLILRAGWHLWRAWRAVPPAPTPAHGHDHPAHADPHEAGCGCGHAHAPDSAAAARASWPEALLLIGGVALRPCTGAVFVMLLTLLIGAPLAGIAAVLAMGLGTALITLAVALTSASLGGQVLSPGQGRALRIGAWLAQATVGALVVAIYI